MCSQYVVHGDILNHVREVQGLYYISIERPSIGTLLTGLGRRRVILPNLRFEGSSTVSRVVPLKIRTMS